MVRLPTNTVPFGPSAIMRAPGAPCAQSSTLKPSGTLSEFTGMRSGAVTVKRGACGASGEAAMLSGRPCCQAGAGGACCAAASAGGKASAAARPMVAESRNVMWSNPPSRAGRSGPFP